MSIVKEIKPLYSLNCSMSVAHIRNLIWAIFFVGIFSNIEDCLGSGDDNDYLYQDLRDGLRDAKTKRARFDLTEPVASTARVASLSGHAASAIELPDDAIFSRTKDALKEVVGGEFTFRSKGVISKDAPFGDFKATTSAAVVACGEYDYIHLAQRWRFHPNESNWEGQKKPWYHSTYVVTAFPVTTTGDLLKIDDEHVSVIASSPKFNERAAADVGSSIEVGLSFSAEVSGPSGGTGSMGFTYTHNQSRTIHVPDIGISNQVSGWLAKWRYNINNLDLDAGKTCEASTSVIEPYIQWVWKIDRAWATTNNLYTTDGCLTFKNVLQADFSELDEKVARRFVPFAAIAHFFGSTEDVEVTKHSLMMPNVDVDKRLKTLSMKLSRDIKKEGTDHPIKIKIPPVGPGVSGDNPLVTWKTTDDPDRKKMAWTNIDGHQLTHVEFYDK